MNKLIYSLLAVFLSNLLFGQTELLQKHLDSEFYQTQFTGFYLYDPQEKKEVFSYNGNKFFTPASNAKIFTLYAAMKSLPDSIPAFKYAIRGDELHIEGTGDPTFMHPKFKNPKVLEFLKNKGSKIILHWNNFDEESFLPGWTWDDFRKKYSPERSQFPINENLVTISKSGTNLKTFPTVFKDNIKVKESAEARDFYTNQFYIGARSSTVKVPFIVQEDVIKNTIIEIVGKPVEMSKALMPSPSSIFYSTLADKVYKEMMEESDNFLAEHLLIVSSSTMNGKLSSVQTIKTITDKYFTDLKQKPIWVDGSGLSRYNMFTPQNLVQVLDKMYKEFPESRLFSIFPVGGKTGTIKNRYKDGVQPYVFAKTGTLSNTITLSGYVKSNSGKTYIFSLMNDHVTKNASWVRNENEKLIRLVRDNF